MSGGPTGTVTFLFTDLQDSTALWENDPAAMDVALRVHDSILRRCASEYRGYVFSTAGDAFGIAFHTAQEGLGAAVDAQVALTAHTWSESARLRVRMALHTGVAVERDGDYFGPPVNLAARLMGLAKGGQVLCTEATARFVRDPARLRDLGLVRLRGVRDETRAFQVVALGLPDDFPPLPPPEAAPIPVRCRVLGTLGVDGKTLSSVRQRRLLAALAMAHGAVVSTDRLVDVVWDGGPPPEPSNALQTNVSRLRTTLGADSITLRPPGYALTLARDSVDAWRFETLVNVARGQVAADALESLDEALALWQGAAYGEFADAEFARGEVARLDELRLLAETARLDALLQLDRADDVVAESVRLVERDPYREAVWERRMRALHQTGRTVDAVRAFQEYRSRLAEETGLEPSADLAALERALIASSHPPETPAPPPPARVALPAPVTSFLGRDGAQDELARLLATDRVVTLTGPGGVGKTRLAIEVASAYQTATGAPAWFVELLPHEPDTVGQAACRALGLADAEPVTALRQMLAAVPALLVLDNCEHVVEAAAVLVEALVPVCPELRVLATSRVRLRVPAERVWTVPPLEEDAASRLFVDRVRSLGVELDVGAVTSGTVATICAAVDGLPLGIELAAALTRELPLDRVADGLAATAPAPSESPAARHRSLDATIDWGYRLLSADAQRLLGRLAVFDGGWSLDAAEAVGAGAVDPGRVAPVLVELVSASFVTFDPTRSRYAMLDTLQTFARSRLDPADSASARDAHLSWCLELMTSVAPMLTMLAPTDDVPRLERELPNLRAALRWALSDDARLPDAEQLALAAEPLWFAVGASKDVIEWIGRILDRPAPPSVRRVELAVCLFNHLVFVGDRARFGVEAERALHLARGVGDRRVLARALVVSAFATLEQGGIDQAQEALAIATELGDADIELEALSMLGLGESIRGHGDEAVAYFEKALATGAVDPSQGARGMLALVLQHLGRLDEARRHLLVAEQEIAAAGRTPTDFCLALAEVDLCAGDLDAAQRTYDRAVLWGLPGDYPADRMRLDATGALLRAEHGDMAEAIVLAEPVADVPIDVSSHSDACRAWLMAGEVLVRGGELGAARQCFTTVLRQRAGRFPAFRPAALVGFAATLDPDDEGELAADLVAAADAIWAEAQFRRPRWLTAGRAALEPAGRPVLTGDEAVALAFAHAAP